MVIRKKKPKHTLQERGIFVRSSVEEGELHKGNTTRKEYNDYVMRTDIEFYTNLWEEREHICFETGKLLLSEPLTLYFHHILGKSKYPQYRHEKWNIVLLDPDIHSQVETFIDKCPRVKALTEHLKIVYG